MFTSLTPSWRSVTRSRFEPLARLLGRVDVGLGDDLAQRRAAAVVVDDRGVGAVDPARTRRCARAWPRPPRGGSGAAARRPAGRPSRAGCRTGRSGSSWPGRDRSSSCGGRSTAGRSRSSSARPIISAEVHGLGVDDRQRAGQAEADRARARVRRLAEAQLAAAEHLRARVELDVDLQADDGLPLAHARPPRSVAEVDRPLERVRGVEQRVLAERRARRAGSRPAGPRSARSGSRSRGCRRATSARCRSR